MKIVFFSNYLNHHQIPLAEAFNSIPGIEYTFVSTTGVPEFRKKLGYLEYKKDFLLDVRLSLENRNKALNLALNADVAIFQTVGMDDFEIPRLKSGKLTFEYSERWLKKGFINLLSPRLLKHQIMYYRFGKNANLYMLCSSAYAANDYYLLRSFQNRCFKWGYFTEVPTINLNDVISSKPHDRINIMWCARFIDWKHPEMIVNLARRLLSNGYSFTINMYGNGPLLEDISNQVAKFELNDNIKLWGKASNATVLEAMRHNHIFVFTSDKNEGWGAVANEAMSNGCTVVASSAIGSVPYLIKHKINGCIFSSGNEDSLFDNVRFLIDNPIQCENFARSAYSDMVNIWSPKCAAVRFVNLVQSLLVGGDTIYEQGPCSKAIPI